MALNNSLRPTPLASKPTVGDAAADPTTNDVPSTNESGITDPEAVQTPVTDTAAAAKNPIGTTAAKLLKGETQDQVNALQKLKYDAWDITLAQTQLTNLKASGGSETDIKAAEASLESARTSYETDLTDSSSKFSLTGARINRYLTGGAHPVPDSALIPSSTDDVSDFIKTMTDDMTAPTTEDGATTDEATTKPADGTTTPAVDPTKAPAGVKNIDSTLSADKQKALADSSQVLATSSVPGVTSGDVSKDFVLYPTGKPSMNDVNQDNSKDCYWLSALTSMASTEAGQKKLQDAISPQQANGDYIVTLHAPSGEPVDIAVNPNNMPVKDGAPAFNKSAGGTGANWVNLYEAAYAKYNDAYGTNTASQGSGESGYDAIMLNGVDDLSFNKALSGSESSSIELHGTETATVAASIKTSLAAGLPVEAYNYDSDVSSVSEAGITIQPNHSYGVVGLSADGKTVTLRNPWGNTASTSGQTTGESEDGTFNMSIEEFNKVFEQVNV